jgi:6,7-dimethyl-8-ribityllumazine synthase
MSNRDIDSTSENVLHDWARDEPVPDAGEDDGSGGGAENADAGSGTPAWGTATVESDGSADSDDSVEPGDPLDEPESNLAEAHESVVDAEPEVEPGPDLEPDPEPEPDSEPEPEPGDEAALVLEPSHEHAAGDLHIPDGYSVLEGVAEGGRRAVGVVVSRFNGSVTTQLLDGALAELAEAGVRQEAITIMVVPGAFELPLAATALAKTRRFACIVALGCVIRGDTPHFDYVSSEAASGLQLAALETGVPVSFGVLTLDRVEQAESRLGKGAEAVRSALEMADLFAHLRAAASR